MLFDLKTGRRRRVVQVVFGFLAFIFFISFVGFGIGSDLSGGIFDAIGLGGDGNTSSTSSQYEQQIDDAESKLAEDPKDEQALQDLARYRFLSGQAQLEASDDGSTFTITEETRSEWGLALTAFEDYEAQDPKNVDVQVVGQVICAYVPSTCLPIAGDPGLLDFEGAAKAQQLLVDEDRSTQNLTGLAYFLLASGKIDEGRKLADEAIAKASGSEREDISKQFDKLIDQAIQIQKAEEKAQDTGGDGAASGEGQLQNPFGGLGTDPTGVAPPAP